MGTIYRNTGKYNTYGTWIIWREKSRHIVEHLKNVPLKQSMIHYGTSHECYNDN
jgi:hypothetical protein